MLGNYDLAVGEALGVRVAASSPGRSNVQHLAGAGAAQAPTAIEKGGKPAAATKQIKPTNKLPWDDHMERLYARWHRRVAAAEEGHHRLSDRYSHRYIWLGLPVVILSTVVGTSAFASLAEQKLPVWGKLAVGGVGILAAVLASAQTFFGFAQRAERHRVAAIRYGTLRRGMARRLALPNHARGDADEELKTAGVRMDKYGKESPQISERMWNGLCEEFSIDTVPPPID